MTTGPLALVGGAEWTDGCDFDRDLLTASGGHEVVVLATAAAFENPDKHVRRAEAWFAAFGATVRAVPVYRRVDALDGDLASSVRSARFVYLADGSSQHLRAVLKDTPVLDAIVDTWHAGAVLAASAQAASALCDHMVDARGGAFSVGLNVVTGLSVVRAGHPPRRVTPWTAVFSLAFIATVLMLASQKLMSREGQVTNPVATT
jgi:cyanophycinase